MTKQSLLLVDGDVRSMRVLEVSLRKAGFTVTTAETVQDGLDKLELYPPDLIISETLFPTGEGDGFDLRRRVRATPDWSEIPFIFLTAESAIENKIKGLELGVDDYLTKPIYIKEIVTRINILLQKRQRVRFEERRDGRTRFAGRVSDMPVVDVIQTIEVSRKSGVIQFVGERGRQATIYFRDGSVIDAESGTLQGEDAVYRLLTWNDGEFEVVFRTVRRRRVIETSSQGLLMEGMRRLDEWSRLLEQLPPVTHRFEVDAGELALRLGDVPDDNNGILRLIDGKRTLLEVIDASDVGDLECLQAISRLYFEEMLIDLDHDLPARRDTGKPMPLVELESSGPMQVATGDRPPAAVRIQRPAVEVIDDDAALDDLDAADVDELEATVRPDPGPDERSDEAPVAAAGTAAPAPGALHGAYRPSSLRLIDEAVAAAQAIEPSLFDDMPHLRPDAPPAVESPGAFTSEDPTPTRPSSPVAAPAVVEHPIAREDSVPYAIVDELSPPSRRVRDAPPSMPPPAMPLPSSVPVLVAGRADESGLRMIGSHGRDRAEASGELGVAASSSTAIPVAEGQRELVTIMPRRSTREVHAIPLDPVSDPSPVSPATPPAVASAAADPDDATPAAGTAVDDSRRDLAPDGLVAMARGPGPLAKVLFALAAVLLLMTLYLWLRDGKQPSGGVTAPRDATTAAPAPVAPAPPSLDAAVPSVRPDAAVAQRAIDAGTPKVRPDAGVAQRAIDAGTPSVRPDAGVARRAIDASPQGTPVDHETQAKRLQAEGEAVLARDAARALALADASIKLRRTARAYLLRAQALRRQGRTEEALAATVEAETLAPTFASIYEVRGDVYELLQEPELARDAYERYLELDPNGSSAERVRRRLGN